VAVLVVQVTFALDFAPVLFNFARFASAPIAVQSLAASQACLRSAGFHSQSRSLVASPFFWPTLESDVVLTC